MMVRLALAKEIFGHADIAITIQKIRGFVDTIAARMGNPTHQPLIPWKFGVKYRDGSSLE